MMKMHTRLLRMVSVFFCIITLFSSCGIATIFYLEDAKITKVDSDKTKVSGSIQVTDNKGELDKISPGKGPSLMLSYIITNSLNPPAFSSPFLTNYRKQISNGVPVRSQELLSVTSSSQVYRLHILSDESKASFRAPEYHALANNKTIVNETFHITRIEEANSEYSLQLSFDSNLYTYKGIGNLRRFNGDPFSIDQSKIIQREDEYPDYTITQPGDKLYLHIFAAFSVTSSNIFWTELTHIGNIELE